MENKIHNISVLYEDKDVVVINKPSGILVHPDGVSREKTISDWAIENYPEIVGVGEKETLKNNEVISRPGIVHRLDKETSGTLLICKTRESYTYLKNLFAMKKIKKEYHALVYGVIKENSSTINKPIGRHPVDFRRRLAEEGARGEMRPAATEFEVVERGKEATFLHAFPLTGRTHQIRAHMKAISHPIVCDSLYAPKKPCLFGINRLALHAYKISWQDKGGAGHEVIAPYPEDFENALNEFRKSVA